MTHAVENIPLKMGCDFLNEEIGNRFKTKVYEVSINKFFFLNKQIGICFSFGYSKKKAFRLETYIETFAYRNLLHLSEVTFGPHCKC